MGPCHVVERQTLVSETCQLWEIVLPVRLKQRRATRKVVFASVMVVNTEIAYLLCAANITLLSVLE